MNRLRVYLLCLALLAAMLALQPSVRAAGDVPPCEPIGTAEGQTLYFCESNYVACVWDPSPGLGAGVVDCDW